MNFEHLKKQWTPVKPTDKTTIKKGRAWGQDARYCLETNKDCSNCFVSKTYGLKWNEEVAYQNDELHLFTRQHVHCMMPQTVQMMIDKNMEIPQKKEGTLCTRKKSSEYPFCLGYS